LHARLVCVVISPPCAPENSRRQGQGPPHGSTGGGSNFESRARTGGIAHIPGSPRAAMDRHGGSRRLGYFLDSSREQSLPLVKIAVASQGRRGDGCARARPGFYFLAPFRTIQDLLKDLGRGRGHSPTRRTASAWPIGFDTSPHGCDPRRVGISPSTSCNISIATYYGA
jgi:hypothetical protein